MLRILSGACPEHYEVLHFALNDTSMLSLRGTTMPKQSLSSCRCEEPKATKQFRRLPRTFQVLAMTKRCYLDLMRLHGANLLDSRAAITSIKLSLSDTNELA